MATFLEVLADTGIVADAVRAAGMERSGAYALRNRDPIVAAAWRDRFFDMLRSELAATTRHPELGSGSIPETRTAFQRNGC